MHISEPAVAKAFRLRVRVSGINQDFRRHAAGACAGRAFRTGIDQQKIIRLPADFPECGQAGRAAQMIAAAQCRVIAKFPLLFCRTIQTGSRYGLLKLARALIVRIVKYQ
jgi:hypothetical protein